MIIIHDLENSRSQRIVWMLEELALPFEVKRYKRDPKTMLAPAELRAIHPLGKAPIVTDGDRVLAESGFICDYFAQKTGKLKPTDNYWIHYAEGSLMPPLLLTLVFSKVATDAPLFIRPLAKAISQQVHKAFIGPQTKLHLNYVESYLSQHEWFSGDFSMADIMMSFPLEAAMTRVKGDRPHIAAFLKKIQARPAYQSTLKKISKSK